MSILKVFLSKLETSQQKVSGLRSINDMHRNTKFIFGKYDGEYFNVPNSTFPALKQVFTFCSHAFFFPPLLKETLLQKRLWTLSPKGKKMIPVV